jgi:hypothetical protein
VSSSAASRRGCGIEIPSICVNGVLRSVPRRRLPPRFRAFVRKERDAADVAPDAGKVLEFSEVAAVFAA